MEVRGQRVERSTHRGSIRTRQTRQARPSSGSLRKERRERERSERWLGLWVTPEETNERKNKTKAKTKRKKNWKKIHEYIKCQQGQIPSEIQHKKALMQEDCKV